MFAPGAADREELAALLVAPQRPARGTQRPADGLLEPRGREDRADGVPRADGQGGLEVDVPEDPTSGPTVEQSSAALHHG